MVIYVYIAVLMEYYTLWLTILYQKDIKAISITKYDTLPATWQGTPPLPNKQLSQDKEEWGNVSLFHISYKLHPNWCVKRPFFTDLVSIATLVCLAIHGPQPYELSPSKLVT